MKLLLAFAIFGIACCMAVPFCSKENIQRCSSGPPNPSDTEEQKVDMVCSETKCKLNIFERCGPGVFGYMKYFPVTGYRKVMESICVKGHPLRSKYFKNAPCIERVTKDYASFLKKCDIKERPREEYCSQIPQGMKCASDYIVRECGEDAGEVFRVVSLPYLDIYDCLS